MSTEIIVWIYEKIGVFVPVFQYFLIKSAMNKKIPSEKLRFHRVFTVDTAKFQQTVLTDIKMMFSLCWMS